MITAPTTIPARNQVRKLQATVLTSLVAADFGVVLAYEPDGQPVPFLVGLFFVAAGAIHWGLALYSIWDFE